MTAQPVYNVEVFDDSGAVIQYFLSQEEFKDFELNHLDDDLDYALTMLSDQS